MPTIPETMALALQHHQAGDVNLAEQLYREVLEADPSQADALHLIGVLALQQGRNDSAVEYIQQALAAKPHDAAFHGNLGFALQGVGRLEEAVANHQQAVNLQPDNAELHNNLGTALYLRGNVEQAAECFQQSLKLDPKLLKAQNNLGNVWLHLGRLDEAIDCYQQVVRQMPNFVDACYNLGNALRERGRVDEAIAWLEHTLRLAPNLPEVYNSLGVAFRAKGLLSEAEACCNHALQIKPNFAEAHNDLGNILQRQGKIEKAIDCYRQALRLMPTLAAARSNLVSCLNYDAKANPDEVFAEHFRFGQLHEPGTPVLPHGNDPSPERRLRIGYVSPDFRRHPVTSYLEPVLVHHDARQVEIYCYAEVAAPDAVTLRLQKLAHHWRSTCRLSDAEVAQRIREDRIDILVDLAGHTTNTRLRVFAHKPAPVQVTWLGYVNTTGLSRVDYRLTDEYLDPPGQPVRDTEELLRLPDGMCCYAPPAGAPAVMPLPALSQKHFTFGSLNNLFKFNAGVFDLWSRILLALPQARLLVFHESLTGAARDYVLNEFKDRGVSSEKLDLRHGSGSPGFLGIYGEIDVSLDVFPCTGGVTTCDSLWMGVPVLTLCGVRPVSRNSAALLSRLGLTEWIAENPEHYLDLAKRIAGDLNGLAELRAGLRDRVAATLGDAPRFTRQLEQAYRTMWRRWCDKHVAK